MKGLFHVMFVKALCHFLNITYVVYKCMTTDCYLFEYEQAFPFASTRTWQIL